MWFKKNKFDLTITIIHGIIDIREYFYLELHFLALKIKHENIANSKVLYFLIHAGKKKSMLKCELSGDWKIVSI